MLNACDHLIVGLDVPDCAQARHIVSQLGDDVTIYKIGYQLAFAGGFDLASELIASGKHVFLDMKLLDIDNTIEKAVTNIAKMGVSMLTLHAYPKAMAAAVKAAQGSDLCLLGVTVLTSMDDSDLTDAGYGAMKASDLVAKRAKQATDSGMGGLVCSAQEAALVRSIVGNDMAVVTPGIRPKGSAAGDQKRVSTPTEAILDGASHLVVARPIIAAPDPKRAAQSILAEIKDALSAKGEKNHG